VSKSFDLAIIPATQGLLDRIETEPHRVLALEPENFADDASTYEGEDLIVLGYPALIGEEYLQRALMRSGVVAWTDPTGASDHEFLIDARIFRGNSGGPVFSTPSGVDRNGSISTGRQFKLLGLVSKTINATPDASFGVSLPSDAMVIGAAGVGIIEPAKELATLIKRAEGLEQ
jgi:hypothetical protein